MLTWDSAGAQALPVVGGLGHSIDSSCGIGRSGPAWGSGGAPDPLRFGIAILLGAILYTWIYNHTDRSVLAVILFHFSGNGSGERLNAPPEVNAYETYLTAALALGALWRWGAEKRRNGV